MIRKRQTVIAGGIFLATLILMPLLVHFVTPGPAIKARLHSPTQSNFAIYWPSDSGAYSFSRVVTDEYADGESEPFLILPPLPIGGMLRIDPISEKGVVTLHGLTIERFGVVCELKADTLAALLVNTVDADVRKTDAGLTINATSADPQLYFKALPAPSAPTSLIALFVLLYLLLFLAAWRFVKDPPNSFKLHFLLGPAVLVLACREYRWPMEIAIPACALFVLAMQHSAAGLASARPRRPHFQEWLASIQVACFLLLIYGPFWSTLSVNRPFLDSIKESLAKIDMAKGLSESAAVLIKESEARFNRFFLFRNELLEMDANIKIYGMGFSPISKVILGKNGMYFEGYGERKVEEDATAYFDMVTDYMGLIPFSEEQLEAWRICLEERYYWLKERGIDYIFALAPSKAMIYPENLPDRILKTKQALNRPSRFEQLSSYLKQHSTLPFVDLSEPLRRAKEQALADDTLSATPLYYRTDFHWTYYGAYVAYRAILEEIRKSYPAYRMEPTPLQDFSIAARHDWAHELFISALGLDPQKNSNDTYLTFMPRAGSVHASISNFGTRGIDDYSLPDPVANNIEGQQFNLRELENPRGEANTIFIVGDSFSEKYFGFFSAHAKRSVAYRSVYRFVTIPYNTYSPQLVIQEMFNMYLLQKPPYNPKEVRRARVAALDGGMGKPLTTAE
ncbi:MAG TPA: hypothetical protein DDY32_00505 [Desulfobulbaceae bacterium]|nr:hypothetical protein [Desulfobulbaceae bacterium]